MKVKLSIYRYDPSTDRNPSYKDYIINEGKDETVLSALINVYENIDPTLSFRFACGKIKCGECAVMVNKSQCLACKTKIQQKMKIEPLPNLPIIKDLVMDRSKAMNRIFVLAPQLLKTIVNKNGTAPLHGEVMNTYINRTACFECLICQSACPVYGQNSQFIGPLGLLWLAQKKVMSTNNSWKELDDMVKMCSGCGKCWRACPSDIKFLENAITALRNDLVKV